MVDNVSTPIPASTKFKTKDFGTNGHGTAKVLYDEAEAEVLGRVTASPTANTVLARLKDITTATLTVGSHAVTNAGTFAVQATNTPLTNFGAGEYETVAAGSTAQALGATGATGDYISGVLVIPATTTPGVVTLLDNAISIPLFVGGASSVSNLVPFFIPLGMISVSGAWKITTGANVSCIGIGNFT